MKATSTSALTIALLARKWGAGGPLTLSALVSLCVIAAPVRAQVPAFPGALGFGANATGGRAGSVYHVTTLADSGAGSFRDAVSHGNCIVVFDVGGYINLSSTLLVQDNITIAGQTAPGDGVGVMGREVSFNGARNVIVRHFRFRQGAFDPDSGKSGINLLTATNLVFDHVSIEFAQYNNIDAVTCDQVTVQNSIIADPIGQRFGAHMENIGANCSWFYNVWANEHGRQPLSKINTIYINNVVYNYQAGYDCGDTSGHFSHDVINNYFITGPSTTSAGNDFYQMNGNQSIYSSGNLRDSNEDGVLNGSTTAPSGVIVLSSPWSALTPNIPTFSTVAGYRYDLSAAGTWPRDQVDQLVISDVKSLGAAGQLWNSQTATGLGNSGYGVINGGIPALDSDLDGMPDYWEKTVGLNPNVNDAMTIAADGYANIEHYLNWLAAPHALTATNTAADLDLWPYTSGFTNASPVYSVNNASNGVVTLNGDGHTAHFTPATNYFGLGSFQFSVLASDGSAYSNTVSVAIVPQSQSQTQPSYLTWRGDGVTNLWAVGSGANWFDGTNLITFNAGDTVTFDDTGSNTPAINLAGALSAGTVYVLAAQDYTFGGSGFLAGATALFKTGSGQLTLDTTNTFNGGMTINDGVLQIGDGVSFNGGLSGNVTNNDTLIYANPAALTSSVNISGPGTVTKNGTGALTLSGPQTYTGPTTVNAGALTLSGTLPPSDISNNTALALAPSASQTYTNSISGPGAVSVSASGTLTLNGTNTFTGNLTNVSGLLLLANNQAPGSGTVVYSGGSIMVGNGIVITNDFSIPSSTSDLSIMATSSATGVWAGNVVNLGSGASWRPGSDGATLVFTGTAAQGARNFIVPRGTVQFASNAVISATGSATALGRDGSANNRSANVTFKDNAVANLGVCSLGGGKSGGSVTVTVQNNAALSFGANSLDLHNVTRATAVNTLRLNGGTTTLGGFTKSQTTYTNGINFNGGVLRAGANNPAFLPAFNKQTATVQAGGAKIDDGGFAITIAQPLIHDSTLGATIDGGLTKLGAGTLTLAGANTYTGPTLISAGTLALSGSGSIGNSTNINVAAGALLDVSGTAGGSFTLASGCTLMGNGSVKGNFTLGAGAYLAPGSNAIGQLAFSNAVFLAAGSTNLFALSKFPPTNSAALVLGSLTYGGTLVVTNVSATQPVAGDGFKLFDAGSYGGNFSTFILPGLDAGLAWDTSGLTNNGTLAVISLAPPVLSSPTPLADGNFHLLFSGTAGQNYELRGATNIALTPLTSWSLLSSGIFGANPVTFDDFQATNYPQRFYRLRVP